LKRTLRRLKNCKKLMETDLDQLVEDSHSTKQLLKAGRNGLVLLVQKLAH
jgi:hypothetical protein